MSTSHHASSSSYTEAARSNPSPPFHATPYKPSRLITRDHHSDESISSDSYLFALPSSRRVGLYVLRAEHNVPATYILRLRAYFIFVSVYLSDEPFSSFVARYPTRRKTVMIPSGPSRVSRRPHSGLDAMLFLTRRNVPAMYMLRLYGVYFPSRVSLSLITCSQLYHMVSHSFDDRDDSLKGMFSFLGATYIQIPYCFYFWPKPLVTYILICYQNPPSAYINTFTAERNVLATYIQILYSILKFVSSTFFAISHEDMLHVQRSCLLTFAKPIK